MCAFMEAFTLQTINYDGQFLGIIICSLFYAFTESSTGQQQTMEQRTEHATKQTTISPSSGSPPSGSGRGISGMIMHYTRNL